MINYFRKGFFLWCSLVLTVTNACGKPEIKSSAEETTIRQEDEVTKWLPSTLGKDLPDSRYLSKQDSENLRPQGETKGGYDPNYRMLAFRRIEGDNLATNPAPGEAGHIEGLRPNVKVIRWMRQELSSKQLIDLILNELLADTRAHFAETLKRIEEERNKALANNASRPTVIIAGLGPVGLLAALEAYTQGSTVIAIEQRSQYTRPQILRLSTDTINRIKYFLGDRFWDYLKNYRGIVSKSPNWTPNKFYLANEFLYANLTEQQALNKLSPAERTQRENDIKKGYELETIEIVRINHLETLLAAVLEELAKKDPEHLRIYYGAVLKTKGGTDSSSFEVELSSGGNKTVFPIHGDVIALAEGAGSKTSTELGIKMDSLSKELYGATIAFRLPEGFDISLRPIENRDGTASVKGIAVIDDEKLTAPGTFLPGGGGRRYTWTMIEEQALCKQLNAVLLETANETNTPDPDNGILLPCDTNARDLLAPWNKTNGGKDYFLPRTRYFFTGGIAYLGAELTERQTAMFDKRRDKDPVISLAARNGLKRFLLLLAKKHMPKEYVEGQGGAASIAPQSLGNDRRMADQSRVIMPGEEAYSLTTFPIVLRKSEKFLTMLNTLNKLGESYKTRIVTLGDTYGTTHFFTGTGAVNGFQSAIAFGEALKDGAKSNDWESASKKVSDKTNKMHRRVMFGEGNAPLDGPFNEPLSVP